MNTAKEVTENIEDIVTSFEKLRGTPHATALKIGINTASLIRMLADTLNQAGAEDDLTEFLTMTAAQVAASTMEMVLTLLPPLQGHTAEAIEKELSHYINLTVSQVDKVNLNGDENDSDTRH